MKRILRKEATLAACLLLASLSANAIAQDQPASASSVHRMDFYGHPIDEKHIYCPIGIEQILPGDYYACEARAAFGRKKYVHTVSMLQESAYWANKDAQFSLGLTYFNGETPDIPGNRPLGLAWLALAAERKNEYYDLQYAAARARSTPEEIQQSIAILQKLKQKYGDAVAAPRAIRNFNHAIELIDESAEQGGTTYLRGLAPVPMNSVLVAKRLHDEADADFNTYQGTVAVGEPEWLKDKAQRVEDQQKLDGTDKNNGTSSNTQH
jgi:hypothetical protein